MKTVLGYPVCEGCKHSSLLYCNKFNDYCHSLKLKTQRVQIPCLDCLNNNGFEYGVIEKEKNEKIGYFHLPGPENLDIFRPLIEMRKYYPEAFYENRVISEIYGSFGGAIWNGRTPNFDSPSLSIQDIEFIKNDIENLGLSINLTWNNHLVSGTDIYDRFCNAITEVFHNGKHSITVASLELFNYLKEKYPNYTYYQSVINVSNDSEGLVKKDERFDMFLWNRKLNNNWNELLMVPENERKQIEFLCNDACTPICNRMGHYNIVNKCLLNREEDIYYIGDYCTIDHDFMRFNNDRWPITITPEQIDSYIDNGFCHFKLCSRGDCKEILSHKIVKYLVKPEFIDDVWGWCIFEQNAPESIRTQDFKENLKSLPISHKGEFDLLK